MHNHMYFTVRFILLCDEFTIYCFKTIVVLLILKKNFSLETIEWVAYLVARLPWEPICLGLSFLKRGIELEIAPEFNYFKLVVAIFD